MGEVKKFELTSDFIINTVGKKLFRIKALISFSNVNAGEIGGYIEKEANLSQSGDAWVYGNAEVFGHARVSGNADYATIKGFGTEFRCTTFFRCKDGCVRVACGCFYGTIAEFREQVNKTREGKIAKEYLMIADLMEMHFEKEEK